jgi:hypothetical protein
MSEVKRSSVALFATATSLSDINFTPQTTNSELCRWNWEITGPHQAEASAACAKIRRVLRKARIEEQIVHNGGDCAALSGPVA